jgi:hypothetical protein
VSVRFLATRRVPKPVNTKAPKIRLAHVAAHVAALVVTTTIDVSLYPRATRA